MQRQRQLEHAAEHLRRTTRAGFAAHSAGSGLAPPDWYVAIAGDYQVERALAAVLAEILDGASITDPYAEATRRLTDQTRSADP
ncbi:hypothetical protein [Saccharopolyspora cebuensis]|uniref:Uncharacterized protein n=1 Tax=Saccharopolyspora cebuensis TaxID=418759 RepID=A0ABV4CHL1_9PSEU